MVLCKNCGKELVVHSSRHVYCSVYCRVAAHQKQRSEINRLARIKTCKTCGKEFNPQRSDSSFCSPKCKQIAYRQRKGAKNQEVQKPFILKVGKLHRKVLGLLDKIDISGYHLADLVEGIPSNTDETYFVVAKTGEQLHVWNQPFPENYNFEERYTQLSPDMMFNFINSFIYSYEMKSDSRETYTCDAISKRDSEAKKQVKIGNLKRGIVFTIGYEKDSTKQKPIKNFLNILEDYEIDTVIDIRENTDYKHQYGKEKLSATLHNQRIKYIEKREYGVPLKTLKQYKSKKISSAEFEKLYRSEITGKNDIKELAKEIKTSCEMQEYGNAVLFCSENYATENEYQDYSCHRSILANMLLETGEFKEIRHL